MTSFWRRRVTAWSGDGGSGSDVRPASRDTIIRDALLAELGEVCRELGYMLDDAVVIRLLNCFFHSIINGRHTLCRRRQSNWWPLRRLVRHLRNWPKRVLSYASVLKRSFCTVLTTRFYGKRSQRSAVRRLPAIDVRRLTFGHRCSSSRIATPSNRY